MPNKRTSCDALEQPSLSLRLLQKKPGEAGDGETGDSAAWQCRVFYRV